MKDYDFNVCIKCQEKNKDIPCIDDCKYLEEMKKKGCGKAIGWYYKNNQKDKPVLCGDKNGRFVELCPACSGDEK